MEIKCKDIIDFMEWYAPVWLAEDWDNVGLLVGSPEQEVGKVMVCLDVTSDVADEAAAEGVDLIISHHPVIFKGIKSITDRDPKGRTLMRLLAGGISVYSAHTNLDAATGGVNDILAAKLGLINTEPLVKYKKDKAYKLVVYVPEDSAEKVRDAICSAGAGWIGNYSDCTFMTSGAGTFRPLDGANPYIGTKGNLETVGETRLETIVPAGILAKVLKAMLEAHPYEEAAYDLFLLENGGKEYGLGLAGYLPEAVGMDTFISNVKESLDIRSLRLIGNEKRLVRKAAVFCGSFDDDYTGFVGEDIDVLVTGDIKYHTAVEMAEMGLTVVDAGHFNTEKVVVDFLAGLLSESFPCIKVITSKVEKEPFKYY